MAATYPCPRYLLSVHGVPKDPPRSLRHIFRCPVCDCRLYRTPSGYWTCWLAGHTKLIEEQTLLERCEQVIRAKGYRVMQAKRIVRIQRRIQAWMQKGPQ